jgi:Tc3 transposase
MPRGTLSSDFERSQITELKRSGLKLREIARRLNRFVTVTKNCIETLAMFGKNHNTLVENPTLSERDVRQV